MALQTLRISWQILDFEICVGYTKLNESTVAKDRKNTERFFLWRNNISVLCILELYEGRDHFQLNVRAHHLRFFFVSYPVRKLLHKKSRTNAILHRA